MLSLYSQSHLTLNRDCVCKCWGVSPCRNGQNCRSSVLFPGNSSDSPSYFWRLSYFSYFSQWNVNEKNVRHIKSLKTGLLLRMVCSYQNTKLPNKVQLLARTEWISTEDAGRSGDVVTHIPFLYTRGKRWKNFLEVKSHLARHVRTEEEKKKNKLVWKCLIKYTTNIRRQVCSLSDKRGKNVPKTVFPMGSEQGTHTHTHIQTLLLFLISHFHTVVIHSWIQAT